MRCYNKNAALSWHATLQQIAAAPEACASPGGGQLPVRLSLNMDERVGVGGVTVACSFSLTTVRNCRAIELSISLTQ